MLKLSIKSTKTDQIKIDAMIYWLQYDYTSKALTVYDMKTWYNIVYFTNNFLKVISGGRNEAVDLFHVTTQSWCLIIYVVLISLLNYKIKPYTIYNYLIYDWQC